MFIVHNSGEVLRQRYLTTFTDNLDIYGSAQTEMPFFVLCWPFLSVSLFPPFVVDLTSQPVLSDNQ